MASAAATRTAKFVRRRNEILDTGCELINVHGVRGMTLTAVARALGLDTSSVTYYFKRKDLLAAACIERTVDWHARVAEKAAAEPDPRARVRRYLHEQMELFRRQRDPAARPLALLSDMRSLDDDVRTPLDQTYWRMLQTVRGFFDPGSSRASRDHSVYATVILVNVVNWLPAWQDRYLHADLARVEERLFDILEHGLSPARDWPADILALEDASDEEAQQRFLHAATNLINQHGYLGASVERIAAELGVSTGSFYHHIDNKDDLVVACFTRSFDLVEKARSAAAELGGSEGDQLARMISSLVSLQLAAASPMLRNSAYQALPVELRQDMLDRTGQVTRHVAGRVTDGVIDGSLRPVDAVIASHVLIAALNGATELRSWIGEREVPDVVGAYCGLLRKGIFAD